MPRFQYTGLELISQFILSERLGPSPLIVRGIETIAAWCKGNFREINFSWEHLCTSFEFVVNTKEGNSDALFFQRAGNGFFTLLPR